MNACCEAPPSDAMFRLTSDLLAAACSHVCSSELALHKIAFVNGAEAGRSQKIANASFYNIY